MPFKNAPGDGTGGGESPAPTGDNEQVGDVLPAPTAAPTGDPDGGVA